jgi:hypothetical protein
VPTAAAYEKACRDWLKELNGCERIGWYPSSAWDLSPLAFTDCSVFPGPDLWLISDLGYPNEELLKNPVDVVPLAGFTIDECRRLQGEVSIGVVKPLRFYRIRQNDAGYAIKVLFVRADDEIFLEEFSRHGLKLDGCVHTPVGGVSPLVSNLPRFWTEMNRLQVSWSICVDTKDKAPASASDWVGTEITGALGFAPNRGRLFKRSI